MFVIFIQIGAIAAEAQRHRRLCELNVVEQVRNVSQTTVVQDAWARGQSLVIHGWIYDVRDGLLRDLDVCVAATERVERNSHVPHGEE